MWQSRLIVVLLAAVGLVILGLCISYAVTAPSLVHAGAMRLDRDLTITVLSEDAQGAGFAISDRLRRIGG